MTNWQEAGLGDAIGPVERVLTTTEVAAFCHIWGQDRPSRFTSEEAAKRDGLPEPIAPGIFSMALLSNLVTNWAPVAAVKKLDVIFRQPVPHNQRLKLHGMVTDEQEVNGARELTADLFLDLAENNSRMVTGQIVFTLPAER
jgi:acyl dehydratase